MTQEVGKSPGKPVGEAESTLTEILTKIIFDDEKFLAVCLDPSSIMFNWIIFKNSDFSRWILKRPALPMEIVRAKRRLEELECAAGIPQQGC